MAIHWGSVELTLLMKKERWKKGEIQFYHSLVQDVDNHFRKNIYMYTGREPHIDSVGELEIFKVYLEWVINAHMRKR